MSRPVNPTPDSPSPQPPAPAPAPAPPDETIAARESRRHQQLPGNVPRPPQPPREPRPPRCVASRRARIALEPLPVGASVRHDHGPLDAEGVECGALRWSCEANGKGSFSACCSRARVHLPESPPPPDDYRALLDGLDHANARSYNNALAFTSLGGKFEQHKPANSDPPLFRVCGRLYHRIGYLLPRRDQAVAFAQTWLLDRAQQPATRMSAASGANLNRGILQRLETILRRSNLCAREFVVAAKSRAGWDVAKEVVLKLLPPGRRNPKNPRLADGTVAFPISALPLRYSLLFPSGADGFRDPIPLAGSDHAERAERRSRSQIDQDHDSPPVAPADGPRRGRGGSTKVSRSQWYAFYLHVRRGTYSIAHRLRHLFCEFVIDGWASAENDRLSYIANHQEEMRLTSRAAIEDAMARGIPAEQLGQSDILASTIASGPRNVSNDSTTRSVWSRATANRICSSPSRAILIGERSCVSSARAKRRTTCPNIVARVFEAKLQALMDDVYGTRDCAGVFGQVLSHIYVIEYQKRGLAHAHILNTLAADDRPTTKDDVDRIVCAEIPDPDLYPCLLATVTSSMLHGKCGAANPRQPSMEQPRGAAAARCKCYYPRALQDETTMNEDGYPTYRRRFRFHVDKAGVRFDDGDVVPYSPYLCAKYDAHINVEICSTIGAIKYMYKYVAVMLLEAGGGGSDEGRNEIEEYVEGRYICAPEAVHRLLGFSIGKLFPAVVRLPVHLEDHVMQCLPAGVALETLAPRRSKLTAFFDLCSKTRARYVRELLHVDVSVYFKWSTTSQRWVRRKYATRTLLHIVQGPRSYDDLKRFESRTYATFRATCAARGLLEDDGEYVTCLKEAAPIQVGHQLGRLFATLLIYCHVAQPLRLFERFFDALADDAAYRLRTDLGHR
ncbi:BQ2448_207 [Microbotryum intermedium]|uniref:BQ2448_207 protein n=1 Tax=Microbotryum intermedium TaxID=269621 RepID=A0A238FAH9_9BASI|nr:BQ2448_207 [Microbotryum intermedium]